MPLRSQSICERNLLQEYLFIPLDIFRKTMENRSISTSLEAWLGFLSFTSPERIEELITRYPRFQAMYQDIYELCLNTEKVMDMYSKELQIMDNNTALYMIDELQERLDETSKKLLDKDQEIAALKAQIAALQKEHN